MYIILRNRLRVQSLMLRCIGGLQLSGQAISSTRDAAWLTTGKSLGCSWECRPSLSRCLQGSSSVGKTSYQLAKDTLTVSAQCLVTRVLRAAGAAVTMRLDDAMPFLASVIGSGAMKALPGVAQIFAVLRVSDPSKFENHLQPIPAQLQQLCDAMAAVYAAAEGVFPAGKLSANIYMELSSQLAAMIATITYFTESSKGSLLL